MEEKKKKKKWLPILIVVIVLFICFLACGDEEESTYTDDNVYEQNNGNDNQYYAADDNADDVAASGAESDNYPVGNGANISFDTVDIYGNPVSNDMLKDARLVMLNLWEPWCGPCVGEMPDLNQLYLDYKDKGLLIIGSYSTFSMDADAKNTVEQNGISYPIIKCNNSIQTLEQDSVPATFLLDRDGNLITTEPFSGARSYSDWEDIIKEYLN